MLYKLTGFGSKIDFGVLYDSGLSAGSNRHLCSIGLDIGPVCSAVILNTRQGRVLGILHHHTHYRIHIIIAADLVGADQCPLMQQYPTFSHDQGMGHRHLGFTAPADMGFAGLRRIIEYIGAAFGAGINAAHHIGDDIHPAVLCDPPVGRSKTCCERVNKQIP